ncbi:hypothetical protein LSH36_361g01051 [Paralvinella palmiformis]|uniref:SAM domain-containing protein n=1 Tax=Paralvinella palmiformis TaxID=53620 RepID=A0AAD9MZF6_9ANNE|nr:hypothetical protein LSH36_361g01051 [Paralvinella palmiformis]
MYGIGSTRLYKIWCNSEDSVSFSTEDAEDAVASLTAEREQAVVSTLTAEREQAVVSTLTADRTSSRVYPDSRARTSSRVYPDSRENKHRARPNSHVYPDSRPRASNRIYHESRARTSNRIYPESRARPNSHVYPDRRLRASNRIYHESRARTSNRIYPESRARTSSRVYPDSRTRTDGRVYPDNRAKTSNRVYPESTARTSSRIYSNSRAITSNRVYTDSGIVCRNQKWCPHHLCCNTDFYACVRKLESEVRMDLDTEYTPKQLYDNFHQNMPFLILTTVGYLGRDEGINAVSSDEMYWVKGIIRLPRVIVANKFGAYFSIPITCKFPIIALKNGARGSLYHEAAVIPLYLPTTLVIAVAMATGDHTDFYKTMLKMHHLVRSIPIPVAFPLHLRDCDDIMIFDTKPNEGHYDVLLPDRYATQASEPQEIPRGDSHVYMPLVRASSNPNLKRPLPKPPAAVTKGVNSGEKQKTDLGQATKYPPVGELVDNYGGSRGPETNIGQLIGHGYNIVIVNPMLAVQELQKVLRTGLIPRKPLVVMTDITVRSRRKSSSVITEPTTVLSGVSSDDFRRAEVIPGFKTELERRVAAIQGQIARGTPAARCSNDQKSKDEAEPRRTSIMDDVPGDLSLLDCDGVSQCLTLLHLAKHKQTFVEAQVDGRLLIELDVEILQREFGFSKFEALKLIKFIGGWRPTTQERTDGGER